MLSALGAGLVITALSASAFQAGLLAVNGDAAGSGAVGSGAVGSGVVGSGSVGSGAVGLVLAGFLAGCGVAALGWAVLALRADRLPAPRAVLVSTLGLVMGSAMLVASGRAGALGVAVLPMLAADLFLVVVAAGAAADLRRAARSRAGGAPARHPLVGLLVGAALVSALATPALAGTAAGELAVPHGELGGSGHHH